ncbi:MAG: 50S ribosomal protein L11 methyltransferase [Alphaproteobacteria bacterium]
MSRRRDAGAGWRVAFFCHEAAVPFFLDALDRDDASVAAFEQGASLWRIEAIQPREPERADIEVRLALAAAAAGVPAPSPTIEPLPARDWLADNLASFRPVAIGRFVVQGSHHPAPPVGRTAIRIDAATAFGTGEHPTTRACLEAIQAIARRQSLGRVLDLGTGSGLLAIAAAKLGARSVLAVDNDPEAVHVARRHARLNGVRARVALADGYRARAVRRAGPYDLIVANILAKPLAAMARDLRRALAPGGVAVLSGLLASQERMVLVPHRREGLRLLRRYVIGDWTTLVLERGKIMIR